MRFDNQFEVAGSPAQVIGKFADVPLMASFLPGASVGEPDPEGRYPASLLVSFGPKRLTFKGTLTNQVDRQALSGVLTGHASADIRGAKLSVTMNYSLAEGGPSRTRVGIVSDAQLTGVLAEFANTGGVVVADAILAEFARRFSAHVAAETQGTPSATTPSAAPAESEALSAVSLAVAVLKSIPRALARTAKRLLRDRRPGRQG